MQASHDCNKKGLQLLAALSKMNENLLLYEFVNC